MMADPSTPAYTWRHIHGKTHKVCVVFSFEQAQHVLEIFPKSIVYGVREDKMKVSEIKGISQAREFFDAWTEEG